jgi:hypothetical protein
MTIPAITQNELDGALGVLPPSAGRLYALVGVSSAGPTDTPATFGRVQDIVSTFGTGPLVEAAAHAIERYGKPVLLVRTGQTTQGACGTVNDDDVAGTSVVTADAVVDPVDDYEVYFEIVTGGTVGTAGITLRYSLDGGRTMSALVALGTANTYTIPGAGVKVNFAVGTLVAGDSFSFRTTAPQWDSTELGSALDALGVTQASWEIVHIVGPVTASDATAIDAKITGWAAKGKMHSWIASARIPNAGETEAAYLSSLSGAFSSFSSTFGAITAGAIQTVSSVNGRRYMRPISFVVAAREAASSEEINTADVNLGSLPVALIRDANGNPLHHDETVNPGLDDARFYVLRTWEGYAGTYVNRPRLFSASGSDFQLLPHRRVMNIAREVSRIRMTRRLNKPIPVDPATGFIREAAAREIEADVTAALEAALLTKPKASAVSYVLSRTDNLLSTKTLNAQMRIVPLAYVEAIEEEVSYENPALRVTSA